jgi:hypothetical protein
MLRKRCKQMLNNDAITTMKTGHCGLFTSAYSYVFNSKWNVAHPANMGFRHGLQ